MKVLWKEICLYVTKKYGEENLCVLVTTCSNDAYLESIASLANTKEKRDEVESKRKF